MEWVHHISMSLVGTATLCFHGVFHGESCHWGKYWTCPSKRLVVKRTLGKRPDNAGSVTQDGWPLSLAEVVRMFFRSRVVYDSDHNICSSWSRSHLLALVAMLSIYAPSPSKMLSQANLKSERTLYINIQLLFQTEQFSNGCSPS